MIHCSSESVKHRNAKKKRSYTGSSEGILDSLYHPDVPMERWEEHVFFPYCGWLGSFPKQQPPRVVCGIDLRFTMEVLSLYLFWMFNFRIEMKALMKKHVFSLLLPNASATDVMLWIIFYI